MKILLIRPYYGVNIHSDAHGDLGIYEKTNNVYPDLIFVTTATILSQSKDVDLKVIDAVAERIKMEDIMENLHEQYDKIIIKGTAPTVQLDLEFIQSIKKSQKDAAIIYAGHIARLLKGYIEKNVKEISEVVEEPLDFYAYRLMTGKEKVTLDDLPSPDYSLFPCECYRDDHGVFRLCAQTSRGCMMGCGYCPYNAFYEGKIEGRSVDKVIEDLKEIMKMKPDSIQFRDQYFTYDRAKIIELCNRMMEEGIKVDWICETRLDNLDEELVDIMAKAGLSMICFGVESGSDDILDEFSRTNRNIERQKQMIHYMNSKDIMTLAFYIVGFPNDTWETVDKTYRLACEMCSTAVKFSKFEPCVVDKDYVKDKELTPDMFNLFQNTMKIEFERNLNESEIEFLTGLFSDMYAYEHDSLYHAYKNEHQMAEKYKRILESVKDR